jgi:hypothetical protein
MLDSRMNYYIEVQGKSIETMQHFNFYNKSDNSANALTQCVIDWIMWNGGQAERISTTGRMIDNTKVIKNVLGHRILTGEKKYIPGTGTKGSADISATIPKNFSGQIVGVSVKLEVKFGKDVQSDAQKKYEQSINEAGGIYVIVRDMDSFLEWWDGFIS